MPGQVTSPCHQRADLFRRAIIIEINRAKLAMRRTVCYKWSLIVFMSASIEERAIISQACGIIAIDLWERTPSG